MQIAELLSIARAEGCSDVHLTMERNPIFRKDGRLIETSYALTPEQKSALIVEMLSPIQRERFELGEDIDFCYTTPNGSRHRVNIFRQQGKIAAAIRVINDDTPSFAQLGLPAALRELSEKPRGLVLVTGPTGSGKSTTLAAMIDSINASKACHILTVEDPIEYVYQQKKAMIHQREVGVDVASFAGALRSALREDPDVILVGEMRDYETISAAITAAETGHLVLSTLHTIGAADTIDRIIDAFPAEKQQQIRTQLASALVGVVTQTLLPRADGNGRVAAFEIMLGNDAILNLIRENKCHQIEGMIQINGKQGMITLDRYLAQLVNRGVVSLEPALELVRSKDEFMQAVRSGGMPGMA